MALHTYLGMLYNIPCSVMVYRDGSEAVAVDNKGRVLAKSSSHASVVKEAISKTPSHGIVTVLGDIQVDEPVVITKQINYYHLGKAALNGSDYLVLGNETIGIGGVEIFVSKIDGQDKTSDGIVVQNLYNSMIRFGHITNCRYGIHFNGLKQGSTNIVQGGAIENCDIGVYAHGATPPTSYTEGNILQIGFISYCRIGIQLDDDAIYWLIATSLDYNTENDIVDNAGRNTFVLGYVAKTPTGTAITKDSIIAMNQGERVSVHRIYIPNDVNGSITIGRVNTITTWSKIIALYESEGFLFNWAGAKDLIKITKDGDVEVLDANRGLILVDRTTGTKYRLYVDNGTLSIETVT